MAEKQYFWLKLENNFFKQKEIKKLRRIAGGDTLTIIYLKMALLSLENNGVLVYEGIEEDFASELALELDEDTDNIKMVLAFLQQHKMIETKGEDFYLNRIPEMTGKETGAAKRMRVSRQRKKQLECNDVTPKLHRVAQSYTEKELEKEIELDTEKDIYIKHFQLTLTNKEYEKLINDFDKNSIDEMIEQIQTYSKSYLKKYSSFNRLIRSWLKNSNKKNNSNTIPKSDEPYFNV